MDIAIRRWLVVLRQQLWFRPLIFCLLGVAAPLLAKVSDEGWLYDKLPEVAKQSVEVLLDSMAASMLVIAVFAVGAMLNAFSAATTTTTPRSFRLVIADNVSQNALSAFLGSFIYSIIALVAIKNEYYGKSGLFVLFAITMMVFLIVTLTFLRWVNRISRLGRMEHTISLLEENTAEAMQQYVDNPLLGGNKCNQNYEGLFAMTASKIGFIQYIKMEDLQKLAEESSAKIHIAVRPGHFVTENEIIAYTNREFNEEEKEKVFNSLPLDTQRSFDEPRFGLISLSEIASRAMSPAVNDPGTAIAVIHSFVRLFTMIVKEQHHEKMKYDRVYIPEVKPKDVMNDAFRAISRDAASNIEVMIRLQKAYRALFLIASDNYKIHLVNFSRDACSRAENALLHYADKEEIKALCLG